MPFLASAGFAPGELPVHLHAHCHCLLRLHACDASPKTAEFSADRWTHDGVSTIHDLALPGPFHAPLVGATLNLQPAGAPADATHTTTEAAVVDQDDDSGHADAPIDLASDDEGEQIPRADRPSQEPQAHTRDPSHPSHSQPPSHPSPHRAHLRRVPPRIRFYITYLIDNETPF